MSIYKATVHFMVEIEVEASSDMEAYELIKDKDVQVEATLNGVKQIVDFNCIGEIWTDDEQTVDQAWIDHCLSTANGTEEQIETYIKSKENA